jgi:hypothetical protein
MDISEMTEADKRQRDAAIKKFGREIVAVLALYGGENTDVQKWLLYKYLGHFAKGVARRGYTELETCEHVDLLLDALLDALPVPKVGNA